MRKKSQVHEDVEYYSLVRGLQAIDRSDVCLLVVDATVGVTEQDQKVAGMAIDRGCAVVLVLNKWDLVETDQDRDEVVSSIAQRLSFASWVPTVNVSALTGRATDKVLGLAVTAAEARASQLKTSQLNDLLAQIRESGYTKSEKGRRLKMMYATQTGSKPPQISVWCNAPDLVDDNFERFVENRLRGRFDLTGTPVRLRFRKKAEGGER
jgi:GTP-binding protein